MVAAADKARSELEDTLVKAKLRDSFIKLGPELRSVLIRPGPQLGDTPVKPKPVVTSIRPEPELGNTPNKTWATTREHLK
jgi:hypothetical protein